MYLYQQRFAEADVGPGIYAPHLLHAERKLNRTTDNEIFYLEGLLAFHASQPSATARRYVHTARAAFAEKGVFPPLAHIWGGLGLSDDIDKRPRLVCDFVTCTAGVALGMSSSSITAGGPLRWGGGSVPTFEIFAPFGTSYQRTGPNQIVYLELSDTATFAQQQRQQLLVDAATRTNCAPEGFALRQPSNASWQNAVAAAEQGAGRVYYRLRQCLASASGPDDPVNCVVSADAQTPAFIVIDTPPSPPGCACRAAGGRSETVPWAMLMLAFSLAGARSRRRS
jgi:MYXO-CTERM domain-containing protein